MESEQFEAISIEVEDVNMCDATILLGELTETLHQITGDSGESSFDLSDMNCPRAVFAIARDSEGEPMGCGCIRPISKEVAELKRMYTRYKSRGIGKRILAYLEDCARELEYKVICLETRLVNDQAVSFYISNGYNQIENYGKYVGNTEAICFEKKL